MDLTLHLKTCLRQFQRFIQEFLAQLRLVHVDPLERKWIKITFLIVGLLVCIMVLDTILNGSADDVELIAANSLQTSQEFAEANLGVHQNSQGAIVITMVAGRYAFFPKKLFVPAETPLIFRVASMDVLHGLHSPGTNFNTMVVPGYIAIVRTVFPKTGEHPVLCNEYCGLGHNHMWSNITVVAKENWVCSAGYQCKPGDKQ